MNEFATNSRYLNLPYARLELAEDRTLVYVRRRFLPQADTLVEVQRHMVEDGERLDQIADQYLGDPDQFWRICDANNAMRPEELSEEAGRRLRITLPAGVQGSPYAG